MTHEHNMKPQTPEQGEPVGFEHDPDVTRQPRVWIASLADYTAGNLHGAWVRADQDPADLEQAAHALLATSAEPGAEEWAIYDYEHFGALDLGEYPPLEDVAAVGKGIAAHGPVFAAWVGIVVDASGNGSLDHELLAAFDTHYVGHYGSISEWAEQTLDELGVTAGLDELSQSLQPYLRIDYTAFAHDAEADGYIHLLPADDGAVWVFLGT
ncbi:antirestriction protein ArdA [Mariniluteicoccus endophyticus]